MVYALSQEQVILNTFCVECVKPSLVSFTTFFSSTTNATGMGASHTAVFPLAFIVLLIISLYTSTIPNLLWHCVFLFAALTDAYLLFYNIFCLLQCKLVTIHLIISLYTTHIKQSVFIHVMDSHHHISS